MNALGLWLSGLLLVLGTSACGDTSAHEGSSVGGSGGLGGIGGSGGTATTSGTGGSAGALDLSLGAGMAGMPMATIPLNPGPGVDLEICKSVDVASQLGGECVSCCWEAGLGNGGVFQGQCACKAASLGGDMCASSDSATCSTCCLGADFGRSSFSPGPPSVCECYARTDASVCKAQNSDANCAVCCINSGYVSHIYDNGRCTCADG